MAALGIASVPLGCKKNADEAPVTERAEAEAEAPPAGETKEADGEAVAKPAEPSGLSEAPIVYPIAIEPLLDLVPADEKIFVAVRDPKLALSLFDAYVLQQVDALLPVAAQGDAELAAEQKKMRTVVETLRSKLENGAIDPSKGLLFLERGQTVIHAAADPQTLPRMLAELGSDEIPKHCAAIEGAEGYVACTVDEAVLAEVTKPAKQGSALRQSIGELQSGVDLERANVLARIETPAGPIGVTVATTTSQTHVAVSLGDLAQPVGAALAARKSEVLGLVAPGSAFIWGQANMESFGPELASQGPPISTVGGTLTGEVLFGGLDSGGMALLAGVDDPYPAAGLISMASLQLDAVPKELDDGTKVAVAMQKLDVAGKEAQVLHVTLSDSPQVATLNKFGYAAEVFGFSAGKLAGIVFGGKLDSVQRTATFAGGGATADHLARLPVPFARSLQTGTAAFAMHLPLDGLQAPTMAEQLAEAFAMAAAETPMGLEPPRMANAVLTALAPYTSLSVWMTHPAKERVVHLLIDGFIDVGNDEGKAASEAIVAIAGGADRKATYAALASSHPTSARALSFKARTGDDPAALASGMTVAFTSGVLAAIAVPAFQSYIEASRAAAGLAE